MPPASRGLSSLLRNIIKTQKCPLRLYSTAPDLAAPFALPKIVLREYQEEAIQSVLSHLEKGHKRLGLSLATGSGKTVIFTQLINRIQPRPNGDQTLILAHRRELVEQAAKHCRAAYPDKSIGIELGVHHATGKEDIIVASMQSIISGERMEKFDPQCFKLVLVDEAHHIVSRGYMQTLAHFGLAEAQEESPALVGVSATLSRFDGLKLGAAIDHITYHKDYIDMIGEKWLSEVAFTTVKSTADISRVKISSGDFQASELSRQVNTDQVNDIVVRSWMHKVKAKSTIVFCVDLDHVSGLTNTFRKHGIDARYVTSHTSKTERSRLLDAFKAGEFPVILNCGVFTEGTDIPNIDCVLLARPTRSRNLLVQMIGRGMRLHPGKKVCHIVDFVASLETGIISTPSLFGLDPGEVLDGATVDDMKNLQAKKDEEQPNEPPEATSRKKPMSPSLTFTDYSSVFELIDDTSRNRHIRASSPHCWVEIGPNKYILTSKAGFLTLEKQTHPDNPNRTVFVAIETAAIPLDSHSMGPRKKGAAPFMRPRQLAQTEEFLDALHAADTYASKRYPRFIVDKRAKWRERPATEGQLALINKLRPMDEQLTGEDLKMGKATDMITQLKHGAKGRFAKIEAIKRKGEKQREKEEVMEERRRREIVSVGPIAN